MVVATGVCPAAQPAAVVSRMSRSTDCHPECGRLRLAPKPKETDRREVPSPELRKHERVQLEKEKRPEGG
jgi:hypothetical protein